MEQLITNPPTSVRELAAFHATRAPEGYLHDNLEPTSCSCLGRFSAEEIGRPVYSQVVVRPPSRTGEFCRDCSGEMVRTGTCTTCTQCGATGGCG